jgi:hypothetical protein
MRKINLTIVTTLFPGTKSITIKDLLEQINYSATDDGKPSKQFRTI